ncbi:MAG: ETC complex I subunit [Alphaproteobacteria bacterium]|nr:ETC complex I subunit [Alphaproteobacteria bacterium]
MKARLYKPSKNPMQSGRGKDREWVLEFESHATRAPGALMGWSAAEDTLGQVRLSFDSQEAAEDYAKAQGLAYQVIVPQERKVKPRNYGDNFVYSPPQPVEKKVPSKGRKKAS